MMKPWLILLGALTGLSACATAGKDANRVAAPTSALGVFDKHEDVGSVGRPGSVVHDQASGTYRVTASGANIWGAEDAFHFVSAKRSGNLHISADIDWIGTGVDPHRKAGLMIRQNLSAGSPYADVVLHGDGLVALQYREVQDGPTFEIRSNVTGARRLRLEKEDGYVYFSVAGADPNTRRTAATSISTPLGPGRCRSGGSARGTAAIPSK